jgi:hypothetical protein
LRAARGVLSPVNCVALPAAELHSSLYVGVKGPVMRDGDEAPGASAKHFL